MEDRIEIQECLSKGIQNHIMPGSVLIHDKESTHKRLVEKLGLSSKSYASKDMKGLADSESPLEPVNRIHSLLKMFLMTIADLIEKICTGI